MTSRPPTTTLFPYTTLFRSPTTASCDTCHRTTAWKPATFSHAGVVPGTCATCHNGSRATGKPATQDRKSTRLLQSLRHLVCRLLLEQKNETHALNVTDRGGH